MLAQHDDPVVVVDDLGFVAERPVLGGLARPCPAGFLGLRRDRQTARVQVHTHPREAGHSRTDDRFSLVPATGFLSLVIPDFAAGPAGLGSTVLVQMQPDGTWTAADPQEAFRVE